MVHDKKIDGDGTKLSGFVAAKENRLPRKCGNCIWYKHDHCHHPIVQIDPCVPGVYGKPKPITDDDCCNFFQSPKKTLVYMLRHGTTDLNAGNKFRGWLNVDLDPKGRNDAKQAAEFLKGKGIQEIFCSDLKRAVETSEIVCEILGLDPPTHDFRLRPWNMGELAGQDREKHKKDLEEYIDNPHWVIPEGESLYQFGDRVQPALEYYLDEARHEGTKLIVTHTSDIIQMEDYCQGKTDGRPESAEIVKPGGIVEIVESYEPVVPENMLKVKRTLGCQPVFKQKNTEEGAYGS